MNPNAEAFKPGPVSPEPGLDSKTCQLRLSQHVLRDGETSIRKGGDLPDTGTLDPKKYDDMFPSLETSTKKLEPPSAGAPSRNKKKRMEIRHLEQEVQALKKTLPPTPKVQPDPDPQGPDTDGKAAKPTSSTPVREPPKTKPHDVKPITPLKLAWVENKQRTATLIPSSAPPSITKAQTMEMIRPTTNMPPTPKHDHELPIQPREENITTPTKANSSLTPLPTHASPIPVLPVAGPFGYPRAMPQPPPISSNGGLFYYPEAYSPGFLPMPQLPMPNVHMYMPQAQLPMEQVAWETFTHPGSIWPTPQQPGLFGPGVPQLWQTGGQQGPQPSSSFDAGSSTREATRTPRQFQAPSRARSRPTDTRRQHRTAGQDVHSRPASTSSHRTRAEAVKQVDTPYFKQRDRSLEPTQRVRAKPTAIEFPREQTPCPTRSTTRMQIQPFKISSRDNIEKDLPPTGAGQSNSGHAGSVIKYQKNNRADLNSNSSSNFQGQLAPKTIPVKPQMIQVISPPEEAPKGPKTSTTLQLRVPRLLVAQTESISGPSSDKTGSWSQSKRWVSGETKERTAFQRMLINLHYMGADKSPFVPQNPAELTAFKAEITETQRVKLLNEVEKMQASVKADGKDKGQPLVLFWGKELQDDLSPVFAIVSCFGREPTTQTSLVEWPSLAELKEEGDKRGVFNTRCFPLPRLNILPANLPLGNQDSLYNPDGSIRWNKKKVRFGFLDIVPVNAPDPDDLVTFDDVTVTELPYSFTLILNHIEGDQEKEQELHKKEEKQEEK